MKNPEAFEKIQRVRLPFDRRHAEDSKNYGIHGLDVWFILKGPKGATQFMFTANAYLPHVQLEHRAKGWLRDDRPYEGYDVGYHSLYPQFDGQEPQDCDIFPGHKCYYDGSSLQAERWANHIFSIRGKCLDDTVWDKLEEEYEDRFGPVAERASNKGEEK